MTLNNEEFALCCDLQFTELVHFLRPICSLRSAVEVHGAGISTFISEASKLKPGAVIGPKWSSVLLTPTSILFPLSHSIKLKIGKSLFSICLRRCPGYLNWEFPVSEWRVLARCGSSRDSRVADICPSCAFLLPCVPLPLFLQHEFQSMCYFLPHHEEN